MELKWAHIWINERKISSDIYSSKCFFAMLYISSLFSLIALNMQAYLASGLQWYYIYKYYFGVLYISINNQFFQLVQY